MTTPLLKNQATGSCMQQAVTAPTNAVANVACAPTNNYQTQSFDVR
ncbi:MULTISPECIES: hypothetical protein [unclassified Streptomyces]